MINKAVTTFKDQWVKKTLEDIYNHIPGGRCSSCGACCYDNVPLTAMEFLNILAYLQEHNLVEATCEAVIDWYANQYKKVQACIFLKHKLCSIYAVRPLTCRLFGHQTKEEQDKRVVEVLKGKKSLAKVLNEDYGIRVADQVVNHVIRQCDFVPDRHLTQRERADLFDQVQTLDAPFYLNDLLHEDWTNLTLVEWFVETLLDNDPRLDLDFD